MTPAFPCHSPQHPGLPHMVALVKYEGGEVAADGLVGTAGEWARSARGQDLACMSVVLLPDLTRYPNALLPQDELSAAGVPGPFAHFRIAAYINPRVGLPVRFSDGLTFPPFRQDLARRAPEL